MTDRERMKLMAEIMMNMVNYINLLYSLIPEKIARENQSIIHGTQLSYFNLLEQLHREMVEPHESK